MARIPIKFPDEVIGYQQEAGLVTVSLTAWRVEVGDKVRRDQLLAEFETDKVAATIDAPCAGTVVEILVPAGGLPLPPETVLGYIETGG